jgi:cytochrome c oxidase subunit 4
MTVVEDAQHADSHHEHPSNALYWKVGLFLAVLTALEVSTYWWPEGALTATALIIMMVIKFAVVALYFMHLKFDSKMLRNVFLAGIVLAIGVYIATLSSMVFWTDSGTTEFIDPPRAKPVPPPPTDEEN